MARLFFIFWIVLGLAIAPLAAQESLYPDVPKGLGEPHPEGNEFMRINHMKLLLHDRDETLRFGNRDISYSLKGCVACHVVNGTDALPISAENPQYFCSVCHEYVAVKVGCFQCHNSKPDPQIQRALGLQVTDPDELSLYIQGLDE